MALFRWTGRAGLLGLVCLTGGCGATAFRGVRPVSAMNVAAAETLPAAQFGQQLAAMRAQGVQSVRSDLPWALVQPQPPRSGRPGWRWGQTDAWAAAFARRGLTWEPILDYSAGWAKTCPGLCAPASNATYAAFAQAAAARYGLGGAFWSEHPQVPPHPVRIFEIWNEENLSTYWVPPGRYASLYSAARRAIHSVDPAATVIVGGLSDDSGSFSPRQDYPSLYVRSMFAAVPGLGHQVDGFGLHPYGATGHDVEEWTVHFRATLDSLGERSTPIYITEFGWPAGMAPGGAWRAQQMSFLGVALSRSNCEIRLLAPYDWVNPGAAPSADFGLAGSGARGTVLRPAGAAWFRSLSRPGPGLRLCPDLTPAR